MKKTGQLIYGIFGLAAVTCALFTIIPDANALGVGNEGPAQVLAGKVFTVNSDWDLSDQNAGDGSCCAFSFPGLFGQPGVTVCSLRAAIEEANAIGGGVTIAFNLPEEIRTISPQVPLPPVTADYVFIDGTKQKGYAGSPVVTLKGPGWSQQWPVGLSLVGNNNTIKGLAIGGFSSGIFISGNDNFVIANFIGLDSQSAKLSNGNGIYIEGNDNVVGSATPALRNVISGNTAGVNIYKGATRNAVVGNYIGTDPSGSKAIGNSLGISVVILAPAEDTENYIGIEDPAAQKVAGNVISGNYRDAIYIAGPIGSNIVYVYGNSIGVTPSGNVLGNGSAGIFIADKTSTFIGGTDLPGSGNTIANSGASGIAITDGQHAINTNSIFSNAVLGIDLAGDKVTLNDPLDADIGPNELLNFPEITSAKAVSGQLAITGSYAGESGAKFRIEYFANAACHASGYGEGQTYLGSKYVETDNAGKADIGVSLPYDGKRFITATASKLFCLNKCISFETSEFSRCVEAAVVDDVVLQEGKQKDEPKKEEQQKIEEPAKDLIITDDLKKAEGDETKTETDDLPVRAGASGGCSLMRAPR